ncbi:hypothetical protein NUW58_g6372 [Xylaria curta]|uniref:Uncharacterized protein n=1 Tax=Xylaria curta TaxID=42375 RepID=A0ACC1NTY8_9PEZI|nr:hypothetical protein NUW58_g6372 [Xylaria curta]
MRLTPDTKGNELGSTRQALRGYGNTHTQYITKMARWVVASGEEIGNKSSLSGPSKETGYSSRRKDKRNGALIHYSQGQCRPYQQSMKLEVEAQFLRLKLFSEELSTTLCRWDGGYRELRQCFAESNGLDWTASQWERFLSFENAFFRLQDELFAVEDEMKQKVAQMYLLVDHTNAPSRRGWLRQDDVTLEGEAEERARNGEHPTLEWNGVDYNATESSYLDYESLSSIA